MPESNALKDKFWQGQIERDTCKMHTVRAHQRILEKSMASYLDDEYCWTAEYSQLWVLHPSKGITADISWDIEERLPPSSAKHQTIVSLEGKIQQEESSESHQTDHKSSKSNFWEPHT